MKRTLTCLAGFVFTLAFTFVLRGEPTPAPANGKSLKIVVMDPLAAPLSCPCVKGYAQRDYAKLATYLEQELERPVKVYFNESLMVALEEKTSGRADIVIGKRSVVVDEAKEAKLALRPILALTGKDGVTTQTGLFVVPAKDPAKTVADLKNYRIIFGPAYCDEKHAAALELLSKNGVTMRGELETCEACSDGAETILELGADVRAATVISSYAAPLLEGCGHVKKGDLRVIGTTKPVPFVTAFVSSKLSENDQSAIEQALLGVAEEPALLAALETKSGFVVEPTTKEPAGKPVAKVRETQKKSR
ncbi:MAG TPA: PhnD/SsuA/transferrin family substrate-binding protein [Planctomycetaceae bacterium]|nr:PhnD/SsuA/transferrin family substrate-binding protein [Planctomycetaceae bacterium]